MFFQNHANLLYFIFKPLDVSSCIYYKYAGKKLCTTIISKCVVDHHVYVLAVWYSVSVPQTDWRTREAYLGTATAEEKARKVVS